MNGSGIHGLASKINAPATRRQLGQYYAKDLWEEFSGFMSQELQKEAQNSLSPHVSLSARATQSPPSRHTCEGES